MYKIIIIMIMILLLVANSANAEYEIVKDQSEYYPTVWRLNKETGELDWCRYDPSEPNGLGVGCYTVRGTSVEKSKIRKWLGY